MRPSWSSFSSVSRAISRRTPSKPESTTAPGVSSMMKSTPVRFSSARMLRPSRPMIRPFMSSAASWTTDTVVSAAWPAARRCMQTERMLRTRRSASRLVSSSIWRIRRAASCLAWSSISLSSSCLALARRHARRAARACARPRRGSSASASRSLLELGLASRERVLAALERVARARSAPACERRWRCAASRSRGRRGRARRRACVRRATAATTIPTAMSAAAPMISMVVPLARPGATGPIPLHCLCGSDRAARAGRTNGCQPGDEVADWLTAS